MKQITKEIFLGFIIGIFANLAGSYLYIFFFSKYDLETSLQVAIGQDVLGNIIALGALFNLAAFFIFLKKKQYYRSRGVLLATLVAAILILISKIINYS